jgi:ATP-dependent Clp protease ATP-binding subunit ClpA
MSDSTAVTIYNGPRAWFDQELEKCGERELLLDIVYERDEATRRHVLVLEGREVEVPDEPAPRPEHVVAASSDYASLNEHVITNFAGLIRSIDPMHLHLHNPPKAVHEQLEQRFKVDVETYGYPAVTRSALVEFDQQYNRRLVGQSAAKDNLLAALYPLTTSRRDRPVVLMFYGPSGVGKTETAQFINALTGGRLFRKQFSMFHNDKFASYVFGGAHAEASFARDLLDRESGVILIDEFDKANPIFHSAFYQLFDDGVFEDRNYRVELGRSLIICTSNYTSREEIRKELGDALCSRFDFLVQFTRLSKDEILQIIDRLVERHFSALAPDEQERVEPDEIRANLHSLAHRIENVRELDRLTEAVFSMALVHALLGEQDSSQASLPGGT